MELTFKGKRSEVEILDRGFDDLSLFPGDESLLISGDNARALRSLLQTHRGKIDLVYIDPPYNTDQVFSLGQRANAISRERGGKTAYADRMDDDDFLAFMRDRFVLLRELLSEKGSLYVHIDGRMGHYFKVMLDEIFGGGNFKNDIARIKANPKNFSRRAYGNEKDMILFYAKDAGKNIWNDVKETLTEEDRERLFSKVDKDGRFYTTVPIHAPGETSNGPTGMPWRGMLPPKGRHWRCPPCELEKLEKKGLIQWSSTGNPRIIRYADEHKGKKIQDVWVFKDPQNPVYLTQKNLAMLRRIILQSSSPKSYVLDCFCGSGTALVASSSLGRKFIGVDRSQAAVAICRKRLDEAGAEYQLVDLSGGHPGKTSQRKGAIRLR